MVWVETDRTGLQSDCRHAVVHCSLRYKPLAGRTDGPTDDQIYLPPLPPLTASSSGQSADARRTDGKLIFLHRRVWVFFTLTTRRIAPAAVVRAASIDRSRVMRWQYGRLLLLLLLLMLDASTALIVLTCSTWSYHIIWYHLLRAPQYTISAKHKVIKWNLKIR